MHVIANAEIFQNFKKCIYLNLLPFDYLGIMIFIRILWMWQESLTFLDVGISQVHIFAGILCYTTHCIIYCGVNIMIFVWLCSTIAPIVLFYFYLNFWYSEFIYTTFRFRVYLDIGISNMLFLLSLITWQVFKLEKLIRSDM